MGWGTNFNMNLYLSHMTFDSIQDVRDKITENDNYINDAKQKIKMFASSTPSSIVPEDWKDEPINWLNAEIESLIDEMTESIKENVLLDQYFQFLENKEIDNNLKTE